MAKMATRGFIALAIFLSLATGSFAQVMSPDPTFDCTNSNFRVIYTACKAKDYSSCCAIGTSCCAGGCCDLTSNCLNVGTPNEMCCQATDPNICGQYKGSGTTPPYAVQSVACTGSDGLSSYYCPPGATCNSAMDDCIGGNPDGGNINSNTVQGSPSSSSPPTPSSSDTPESSTSIIIIQESSTMVESSTIEESSTMEESTTMVEESSSTAAPVTVTVVESSTGDNPSTTSNGQGSTITVTAKPNGASRSSELSLGLFAVILCIGFQRFLAN